MTPAEVVDVLAKCAAYDRRTVGQADVLAWHEVLADIEHADALVAVGRHYRDCTEWLQPAHIRRLAAEMARERHRIERERAERLALEAEAIHRGPVSNRSAEVTALVREVVAALPVADTDRIHTRALMVARKTKGRPDKPARAAKEKRKPKDWPPPQTDEIAAMATRYLLDGYEPTAVAERLAVSRKWCQQIVRRLVNGKLIDAPEVHHA